MIKEDIKENKEYIINLRREFHMYPEVSFKEYETSKRIKLELEKLNIEYIEVAKTGIVATIFGDNVGKTIALRADIDALAVTEKNELEYKSKNIGVMHACGHDGHIASLIGAAKILNNMKNKICGKIKLIFQPAEEIASGALVMLEENILEDVDEIFGLHLWLDIPCGYVAIKSGVVSSAADRFEILIKGKGGHGSMPDQTIDPIVTGSAIVMNLQTIISRETSCLDSAVVSVGAFESIGKHNIIPSTAKLTGTVRTYSEKIRNKIYKSFLRIVENTAASYGAKIDVNYTFGTPSIINTENSVNIAKKSFIKLFGENKLYEYDKMPGSEDFSRFTNLKNGVYIFVGAKNIEKNIIAPHHNEFFNIDENSLEIATALYVQYALDYLKSN